MEHEIKSREFALVIGGVGDGIAGGTLASSGLNPDAIIVVVADEIEWIDVEAKLQLAIPLLLETLCLSRFL